MHNARARVHPPTNYPLPLVLGNFNDGGGGGGGRRARAAHTGDKYLHRRAGQDWVQVGLRVRIRLHT
jgi:hypothetical protein